MTDLLSNFRRLLADRSGTAAQGGTALEYCIIGVTTILATSTMLTTISPKLSAVFNVLNTAMS